MAPFYPKDRRHSRSDSTLGPMREALSTTVPVLTEAFPILEAQGIGSAGLRDFIAKRGMSVRDLDHTSLLCAFELMEAQFDHQMDLVRASIVGAVEELNTRRACTIARGDFQAYWVCHGNHCRILHTMD